MEWLMDEIEDIDAPATPARTDREKVPEGRHTFRICRCSEDGSKLKVGLCRQQFGEDDDRYGWVWLNAYRDRSKGREIVVSLLRALGTNVASFNRSKPSDLEDRLVDAEIVHRQDGEKLWVNVVAFMEASKQAAPKQKAPPKASAVEKDDSIPF